MSFIIPENTGHIVSGSGSMKIKEWGGGKGRGRQRWKKLRLKGVTPQKLINSFVGGGDKNEKN